MTDDERQINPHQLTPPPQPSERTAHHTSIGAVGRGIAGAATIALAVGGGVAGAAIGHSLIGGKLGTAIGVVSGAVVGGVTGDKLAKTDRRITDEIEPTIGVKSGANDAPVNLPAHYTWTELQALSKPQR